MWSRVVRRVVRRPSVVNFSHFRLLLWNCWTEFNETWQEARSQRPLLSLCFSGRPGLWLAETFSTSPLKLLNEIERNLTGSKISTSSTKFVFFGPIGKTRWPPLPLIGWDISTSPLKPLTRFNETWQETRSQRPLTSLCFLGRSEKQNGRPGLWLAETFSTSPLKRLNRIERNLTGSKISSSTKFIFFGQIGKTRLLPWPIPKKGGTLFSGARYVTLWASCLKSIKRFRRRGQMGDIYPPPPATHLLFCSCKKSIKFIKQYITINFSSYSFNKYTLTESPHQINAHKP